MTKRTMTVSKFLIAILIALPAVAGAQDKIAENAKAKGIDWIAILRPAACALAKMVEQYKDFMGAAKPAFEAGIGVVKGTACD